MQRGLSLEPRLQQEDERSLLHIAKRAQGVKESFQGLLRVDNRRQERATVLVRIAKHTQIVKENLKGV